ncbi:MAG: hypothetical protein GX850_06390 [Clostridiaceae bacterium]|nr:hypothetical protein [Clostridiaceae bacterium]
MNGKKGVRFLLVLLVISGGLLLLSMFGITQKPVRGAKRFQLQHTHQSEPDHKPETTTSIESNEPEVTQSKEPEDTAPALYDLPIVGNDPDQLPASGASLRLWPQTLAIPKLYDANLSQYYGQASVPLPLSGITVILDASRGGTDTGAVWGAGEDAVMEKTIVLEIAGEAEKALTQLGASVVQTRTTDEEFSLFWTVAKAADVALMRYGELAETEGYKRDVIDNLTLLMGDIIRINQNSPASGGRGLFGSIGTPPQLRILYDIEAQYTDILFINIALAYDADDSSRGGSQAYYMSAPFVEQVNNGYAAGQDALTLPPNYTNIDSVGRAHLASLLKAALGRLEPWLKPEDQVNAGQEKDMAILRLTNYVSTSFVPGYLSNESDRAILTSPQGRGIIGQAIANAVLQYFVTPHVDS